ncbi:DedA family protein [Glaciecola sp. MH2013]|uniref:YqaA family protein n=1 Tax=Glaciecola sp. MH2013 TaxID=2785524 RepID=UPI00189FCC92|nr:VTT domain-containing protein [Glaciecola sp. MH2013]MBF7074480.1 DedA family protein [Glaciecola sp. MH2013]
MSIKAKVKKLIESKHMLSGITLASFLESTVVPIPLEALLVPLMQKRREKLWLIAFLTTLGCLFGALLGYTFGYFLFEMIRDLVMQYLTTEEQFKSFQEQMARDGFWFIFSTGVTPIPLQIAMLAAGVSGYSLGLFMLAVALGRIIRYFGIAVLVYYFGDKTEKLIKRYKWQAVALACVLVAMAWWLMLS